MNQQAIDHVLDEAVELMIRGNDPHQSAEHWPAHSQALEPLLMVAHELLVYGDDNAKCLDQATACPRPIDWATLLADVSQVDEIERAQRPARRRTVRPRRVPAGMPSRSRAIHH